MLPAVSFSLAIAARAPANDSPARTAFSDLGKSARNLTKRSAFSAGVSAAIAASKLTFSAAASIGVGVGTGAGVGLAFTFAGLDAAGDVFEVLAAGLLSGFFFEVIDCADPAEASALTRKNIPNRIKNPFTNISRRPPSILNCSNNITLLHFRLARPYSQSR